MNATDRDILLTADEQGVPLTVNCDYDLMPLLRQTIATLPNSFRRATTIRSTAGMGLRSEANADGHVKPDEAADHGEDENGHDGGALDNAPPAADVVVISGGAGWATRAQSAVKDVRDLRAIVVLDPQVCPTTQVSDLAASAERHAVLVRFSETFAGNPVLEATRRAENVAFDHVGGGVFLSGVSHADTPSNMLLPQLRVLRSLGITGIAPRSAHHRGSGLTYTADWCGALVVGLVTTARSLPASVRVDGVGGDSTTEVHLPSSATARPAGIRVNTVRGAWEAPTHYETSHRAALRRVHSELTRIDDGADAKQPALELQQFIEDLRTIERFLPDVAVPEDKAENIETQVAWND